MDISSLGARYLSSCRRLEMQPNSTVLSWFCEAKLRHSHLKKCRIAVSLNELQTADITPLIDVFLSVDSSDIHAVDILYKKPCTLKGKNFISLMQAIKEKLQMVDLREMSLGNDLLWDLFRSGLACRVLKLRLTNIQQLNMVGRFTRLHTLNMDFSSSITSLHEDCFSCMPNLMRLSMCETRITNLWTTTAALLKLPSLTELRFQNCLCCEDTGPCTSILGASISNVFQASGSDRRLKDTKELNKCKASSDAGVILSGQLKRIELSSDFHPYLNEYTNISNEDQDISDATVKLMNYASHHPSTICFEKHYRDFMVASLPHLKVLDNLPIRKTDKEKANNIFSQYFEYLPYKRKHKESVVSVLQNREMGTNGIYYRSSKSKQRSAYGRSHCSYSRSLSAAKFGSSVRPFLHPVTSFSYICKEGNKRLRPRQFEYHPSDSSLMAFGTLDGEVVVINHEQGNIVGYISSIGATNSVLGLCWLKNHPSKLVAGSDNGCLRLFDINYMPPKFSNTYNNSGPVTFSDFEQLTSVHVNSTDDQFLASGYSKSVALYDINTGVRLQLLTDMHKEPINVAKFAHHSPFMFATCSFDRDVKMWDLRQKPVQPCYTTSSSRGNVMVCFSPDDLHLLVSAVDNEVKQLLAVDGRIHMDFEITSSGSAYNYTRSYYINGRDYIISGSCEEHVVRICCAQTGKRLKDFYLDDRESEKSMFVQSLRGDPFRDFNMSVLAISTRPSSKWEIIKVNLLASSRSAEDNYYSQYISSSDSLGG